MSHEAKAREALSRALAEAPSAPAGWAILESLAEQALGLIAKNRAYGNSALEPLRVFSRASAREQILVRIDDKLSRLARGEAAGEDTVADLRGYLTLLDVAERMGRRSCAPSTDAPTLAGTGAGDEP